MHFVKSPIHINSLPIYRLDRRIIWTLTIMKLGIGPNQIWAKLSLIDCDIHRDIIVVLDLLEAKINNANNIS